MVRTGTQLVAGIPAYCVDPVAHHAEPGAAVVVVERRPARSAQVGMAAGLRERLAAEYDARPAYEPLVDRRRQAVVGPADVADGGEPARQHSVEDAHGLCGDVVRRPLHHRAEVRGRGRDVDMGVDKTRHDRAPARVEHLGVVRRQLSPAHRLDPAVGDEYAPIGYE